MPARHVTQKMVADSMRKKSHMDEFFGFSYATAADLFLRSWQKG